MWCYAINNIITSIFQLDPYTLAKSPTWNRALLSLITIRSLFAVVATQHTPFSAADFGYKFYFIPNILCFLFHLPQQQKKEEKIAGAGRTKRRKKSVLIRIVIFDCNKWSVKRIDKRDKRRQIKKSRWNFNWSWICFSGSNYWVRVCVCVCAVYVVCVCT